MKIININDNNVFIDFIFVFLGVMIYFWVVVRSYRIQIMSEKDNTVVPFQSQVQPQGEKDDPIIVREVEEDIV